MVGRFDLFYSLEHEKQKHIIDAAMSEFGEKGFRHASTNAIVEKAGISKGMLFYYFGSKEELFDFIFDYTFEFWKGEYLQAFSESVCKQGDFLGRFKQLSDLKRRLITDSPRIVKFLEQIYAPEPEEQFLKHLEKAKELREQTRKYIYDNIDYSLFRDDVDPHKTVIYIKWLMESYEADLTAKFKTGGISMETYDLDKAWEQYEDFAADLRKIFYKN